MTARKSERFTRVSELKEFRDKMEQYALLGRELRQLKERAAATLGETDSITLGSLRLQRDRKKSLRFSKDLCVSLYGSNLYETCRAETISIAYSIKPANK